MDNLDVIMNTQSSYDPNEIWISFINTSTNYFNFISNKHTMSWITLNFPKTLTDICYDEDFENATISGTVFFELNTNNNYYSYITTPFIYYNKSTQNLEIKFMYNNILKQKFLNFMFTINKNNLIKRINRLNNSSNDSTYSSNDSTNILNDSTNIMNDSTYLLNDSTYLLNDSNNIMNDSTYLLIT